VDPGKKKLKGGGGRFRVIAKQAENLEGPAVLAFNSIPSI
jgi:hypothetical protein